MFDPKRLPEEAPSANRTDPPVDHLDDDVPFELFVEELPEAEALALASTYASSQTWSSMGGASLSTFGF